MPAIGQEYQYLNSKGFDFREDFEAYRARQENHRLRNEEMCQKVAKKSAKRVRPAWRRAQSPSVQNAGSQSAGAQAVGPNNAGFQNAALQNTAS